MGAELSEEKKYLQTPEDEAFDKMMLNQLAPSAKAVMTKHTIITKARSTMVEQHDRFCHLLAGGLGHNEAFRLAGYATPMRWQSNALKLWRSERTQEKLKRFKGGNYSIMSTDLTADAIMTNMKNCAVMAEKAGDWRGSAAIYEKLAQQLHGMFLQKRKDGTTERDLPEALRRATAEEIAEALNTLGPEESADSDVNEDEDITQVQ